MQRSFVLSCRLVFRGFLGPSWLLFKLSCASSWIISRLGFFLSRIKTKQTCRWWILQNCLGLLAPSICWPIAVPLGRRESFKTTPSVCLSVCLCVKMVGQTVMRIVRPCFRPSLPESQVALGGAGGGTRDGLLWYKDTGKHACGDFSMAVVQANNLLEDGSQVEAGPLVAEDADSSAGPCGTFVGIYDGHGGPETAHFIADNLFQHLKKFATEQQTISADVIQKSYAATEEGFLNLVRKQWLIKPQLASVGSCCLVGIINEGVLYVANAGDSRAVLGRVERGGRDIKAVQLSSEHNASIEAVRGELRQLHPDDPRIVVLKHNVWRVKGLIQVSRTIGDAYLKSSEFNREPLLARFRLPKPFHKPILCPEPSIEAHRLCAEDQFVIFASDGLWEHLSNQEAVDIVNCSPRNGVARRLIKAALREAAKKREMRYSDLKKIDRGVRRHFHDDITVVVLFLDSTLISKRFYGGPLLSLRGGGGTSMLAQKC